MEDRIKFTETVFLIDGDYLNHMLTDVRGYFSVKLNRELPDINLDQLITYLALDARVEEGEKDIMVILVHDNDTPRLKYCNPSDFKEELNNVAFKNHLGEFQFTSISPEGFTTNPELFLNILDLITNSQDVKKMVLIPFEDVYIEETLNALENCNKQTVLFGMKESNKIKKHQWEVLAFPLMQALSIKGDEI